MGKSTLSIGDDTPSGEPNTGPQGPYITDRSDDATRRKPKARGKDKNETARPPEK